MIPLIQMPVMLHSPMIIIILTTFYLQPIHNWWLKQCWKIRVKRHWFHTQGGHLTIVGIFLSKNFCLRAICKWDGKPKQRREKWNSLKRRKGHWLLQNTILWIIHKMIKLGIWMNNLERMITLSWIKKSDKMMNTQIKDKMMKKKPRVKNLHLLKRRTPCWMRWWTNMQMLMKQIRSQDILKSLIKYIKMKLMRSNQRLNRSHQANSSS